MVSCNAGGTCNGGDPSGVYDYAYTNGIPDSSCEQYVAANLDMTDPASKSTCRPIDICRDCTWPPPPEGDDGLGSCWATDYRKYYVSDYYGLSGADKMKAEIFKNGPISCGI
jgi:cathepsin X